MRDLNDLVAWLEYGRTSGYIAARESKEQEEHWAQLLRELIAEHEAMDTKLAHLFGANDEDWNPPGAYT